MKSGQGRHPICLCTELEWYPENRRDGREYAASDWMLSWLEAETICTAYSGTLASASTEDENTYLADRFTDPSAE